VAIFAQTMLSGDTPTINGDGNQTRDYVFIDDTVDALARAMERGSARLLNIGTGLETSVNGLFRMLAALTGFTGEPRFGPLPPGEPRRIALDATLAETELGWHPWTHLEDGLGETVAFLKGV
jgi:UDP-glucose 4-epimerase